METGTEDGISVLDVDPLVAALLTVELAPVAVEEAEVVLGVEATAVGPNERRFEEGLVLGLGGNFAGPAAEFADKVFVELVTGGCEVTATGLALAMDADRGEMGITSFAMSFLDPTAGLVGAEAG